MSAIRDDRGFDHPENFYRKPVIQIICFTILALLVHALVLKFIFPGYYSPLYPHHSDFYISVALAHSPDDFFQYRYMGYSRPLGLFFLKFIGLPGIHGAILFTVINVAVNGCLSIMLVQRILKIEFKWPVILLFCLYFVLLFSQRYFYTFYTQDIFSHLSYSFLISGTLSFISLQKRNQKRAFWVLLFFSIVAFLCKETYALSAVSCAFFWFLYNKKHTGKTVIAPFLAIVSALVLVIIFNLIIKSVFIKFQTNTTDPYYINLRPSSIFNEMILYAKEGLNFLHWIIVVIAGIFILTSFRSTDKRAGYTMLACVLAAFLSWLPNALIPNHHHGGYSFNGAYLLYLPVVFIPVIWNMKTNFKWLTITLILISIISPFLNKKEYEKQWWVLLQENIERNLLKSLDTLMILQPASPPKNILITGLTMPFFPFHHPASLKEYPNSKNAIYDVVDYTLKLPNDRYKSVKFVLPAEVNIRQYDVIWAFDSNGKLLRNLTVDSSLLKTISENNCQDLIVHPDSTKIQKLFSLLH
jgi:hypothetical protein